VIAILAGKKHLEGDDGIAVAEPLGEGARFGRRFDMLDERDPEKEFAEAFPQSDIWKL